AILAADKGDSHVRSVHAADGRCRNLAFLHISRHAHNKRDDDRGKEHGDRDQQDCAHHFRDGAIILFAFYQKYHAPDTPPLTRQSVVYMYGTIGVDKCCSTMFRFDLYFRAHYTVALVFL